MPTLKNIPEIRCANQLLAGNGKDSAAEVVRHMGMIQAQDYLGALWAVGVRMGSTSELEVEQALADRSIVRTWPARGTLHFVPAEDVRWMLNILASRVLSRSHSRYRQLELVPSDFSRSREQLIKALQGGRQLTRAEAYAELEKGGVSTAGQRGIHILGNLAMHGLICLGSHSAKQHTFVLLDEWVPPVKPISKEEALARLAVLYITGHGPATTQDLVWWSGLTLSSAKAALESVRGELVQESFNDETWWLPQQTVQLKSSPPPVTLLPPFDEYLVGYKNRDAVLDPGDVRRFNAGGGMLNAIILIDGRAAGTWKRRLKKNAVVISPTWFEVPSKQAEEGFEQAVLRYANYLGRKPEINPA